MSRITMPVTTVKTPREYEEALVTIMTMLVKVNVLSFAALEAIPDLYEELCGALYQWAHRVAFPRFRSLAAQMETTCEDLASDWYAYAMRMSTKPRRVDEETGEELEEEADASHPTIDRFLNMARMSGARTVVAYMMTATGNFVRSAYRDYWRRRSTKEERKEREEAKKRCKEHPEEQEKSQSSRIVAGQKAGVNPNIPRESFVTGGYEDIELREAMTDVIRGLGEEKFLGATSILSDALGYERKDIARIIFWGKHVQLAVAMAAEVSCRLHRDCGPLFEGYIRAARAFILPPHLKESEAALLRALYRATASDKRAVFAGGNPFCR